MELRCQNCGSKDLKRVSLIYEQGLTGITAKSRLQGISFGGDGPRVFIGRSTANGVRQTDLSRKFQPPKRWSYRRLALRAAVVSFAALVGLIHLVMASSSRVSSLGIEASGVVGLAVFAAASFLTWRHNHLVYPRLNDRWNRSFVCLCCAAVGQH